MQTRSQEFIRKNRKRLACGKDFYNPDSVLMPPEEFDKRPIKFLLIMPTPSEVKTVSSTLAAVNDFIITNCPNVFVDFAFYPNKEDIKLFDKHSIPYGLGLVTHLDASHFDIVGFSISVLSEVITAPCMLRSFERCDNPIPLTWTERKDLKLGTVPLITCGGITASCGDIMFGDLGDGRQSFIDFTYLGAVEKFDFITNRLEEALLSKNLKETLTIQDFIDDLFDSEHIYQPQAYKVVFNDKNQVIENTKINPRAQDEVRPYYPSKLSEDMGIGRSYIPASGDNAGVSQVQVSEGCSGSGSCTFCHEGYYTGAWVEKPRAQILDEAKQSKKFSASYKFKPYSFNCNYLTDYKGLLYDLIQIYPKVSFINMRMEELGRDTDALKMMKMIGSNRISAPMEGISPRIQNNLLNKNLSQESLDNFMNDLIHMKMTDIKVGGIFTGYEEDQDFQWIVDFVSEYKKKAKMEGGNLPFRLKMTPMVHYHTTPVEYIERKSAKLSYEGEHWLTDEWYAKFKEAGIYFKVNGFRYSTFIEQCIIDLGRSATQLFYELVIKDMKPAYSLRSFATDEVMDGLRAMINPDYFFALRDPDCHISLAHRIHTALMGSGVQKARDLYQAAIDGNIFNAPIQGICLKTFEGAPVKCTAFGSRIKPLFIYNDVKRVNDMLVGSYRPMAGCESCASPMEKKQKLARPMPETRNSDDLIAAPRIQQVQKVRLLLRRMPSYDLLNPNNTAHTPVAKLLQASDKLLDAFHSIKEHSMFWQSDGNQPYVTSGYQLVDTIWSEDVVAEIKRVLPLANAELKSVKIESVKEELMDEKIKVDDYNIFYFESDLPYELFEASKHGYKGEIRVKTGMDIMEVKVDKTLKPPVFVSKGKTFGYFALPLKYNPDNYLQGFFTRALAVNKIVEATNMKCVMVVREASNICKNCGVEKSTISLITGKSMSMGIQCLTKALLSQNVTATSAVKQTTE